MNYQILINLTDYNDSKSFEDFNLVIIKIINNESLLNNDNFILNKIRSYSSLILSNKCINISLPFVHKIIIVNSCDDIDNILKEHNTFLQKTEILSDNGYYLTRLRGGLGNQLFMSLSVFSHANKNNRKFAISHFDKSAHSNIDYKNTVFSKFLNLNMVCKKRYKEESGKKNPNSAITYYYLPVCDKSDNVLFTGYFQNEKYFNSIKKDILNIISLPPIDLNKINILCENSFFVHVRLGDYVGSGLDFLKPSYFKDCIYKIKEVFHDTKIVVISNDINGAKKYFSDILDITYVENLDEFETLQLMINCKNGGAISNSSFSWWGGYLNGKNIYIPDKWFNNNNNKIKSIDFEMGIKIKT